MGLRLRLRRLCHLRIFLHLSSEQYAIVPPQHLRDSRDFLLSRSFDLIPSIVSSDHSDSETGPMRCVSLGVIISFVGPLEWMSVRSEQSTYCKY